MPLLYSLMASSNQYITTVKIGNVVAQKKFIEKELHSFAGIPQNVRQNEIKFCEGKWRIILKYSKIFCYSTCYSTKLYLSLV
jgi:hypothetical protein